MAYIECSHLQIDERFYRFVVDQVIPGTGLDETQIWSGLYKVVSTLSQENELLLQKRSELQGLIDTWHRKNKGNYNKSKYRNFLEEIGYLVPDVEEFSIETENVDREISHIAGPQLVVPLKNSRFAINAANARWGSLYDALYGTDVISGEGLQQGVTYNSRRGQAVIHYAKSFLDDTFPLDEGSHHDVVRYFLGNGKFIAVLESGERTSLYDERQFAGYDGSPLEPSSILLKNNELHVELRIDSNHPIGVADKASIYDIHLESAITTIQDCEDSVAAVDAEDKIETYSNWLGLMKGSLEANFEKGNQRISRTLAPNRYFTDIVGNRFSLRGQSLLLIRNVGLLMSTSIVLTERGDEIPEGILDGFMSGLIGIHDLKRDSCSRNSTESSIYIVKPKLHGPEEVAFSTKTFSLVEEVLGLPKLTIKIGVMDEEKRLSMNLKACIRAAKNRIVFVNTGFLDRTGDEIHTSMEAGPFVTKRAMKQSTWINAYEEINVRTALGCGFHKKAQIGKGMWAMPDKMSDMVREKIGHLKAGASTAWVPSPTAATLHAMHYHKVSVFDIQQCISKSPKNYTSDDLLELPLMSKDLSLDEMLKEIDNNIQGILGYVTRWVDQGVGCSKVLDLNDIGLMEDRATLRISSQYICNWLHHGVCTRNQVLDSIRRMSKLVDQQNVNDPMHQPLFPCIDKEKLIFDNRLALLATQDLIFHGKELMNGYTELVLHRRRQEYKKSTLK